MFYLSYLGDWGYDLSRRTYFFNWVVTTTWLDSFFSALKASPFVLFFCHFAVVMFFGCNFYLVNVKMKRQNRRDGFLVVIDNSL